MKGDRVMFRCIDAATVYRFLFMRSDGEQLGRITELVDSGTIRPVVGATVPFDQTSHALRSLGRGVRGKTVVTLPHH